MPPGMLDRQYSSGGRPSRTTTFSPASIFSFNSVAVICRVFSRALRYSPKSCEGANRPLNIQSRPCPSPWLHLQVSKYRYTRRFEQGSARSEMPSLPSHNTSRVDRRGTRSRMSNSIRLSGTLTASRRMFEAVRSFLARVDDGDFISVEERGHERPCIYRLCHEVILLTNAPQRMHEREAGPNYKLQSWRRLAGRETARRLGPRRPYFAP